MSWYYTTSHAPKMEQIVIDPGAVEFKDARRMLLLGGHFVRVYQSFWISVLVKLDNEKNSTILIKANNSTSLLKNYPFKIGFSFIKGSKGNLFALFVEFDGPCPPNCPSKPLVFLEDLFGLDFEENRARLLKSLYTESLNVWLAEGGDAKVAGEIMTADSIDVKYETIIRLEPECRTKLNEVAAQHLGQHLKIGQQNWDYQKSFQEFCADMPLTMSPILPPVDSK